MTLTDGLRTLVTKLGGTPTENTVKGLLKQALKAVGGTPTGHSTSEILNEYAETNGESEQSE